MPASWKHKLPNCYFVGPDGHTFTAPAVDAELLGSPLVRRLLGLEPAVAAAADNDLAI
jgi:hypothetical protein